MIGGVANKISDGRLVDELSLAFAVVALERLIDVRWRSFTVDPEATG